MDTTSGSRAGGPDEDCVGLVSAAYRGYQACHHRWLAHAVGVVVDGSTALLSRVEEVTSGLGGHIECYL